MKNKTKNQLLWFVVVALAAALIYIVRNPKVVKVPVQVGVPMQPRPKPTRAPEFREAPIKKYKPGYMQQMGILTGAGQETLPLYGKEVRGRRDRYHYYTTTGGENLYQFQLRLMDGIVWKTLVVKNFMDLKQSQ